MEEAQGRGLGRRLVEAVILYAKQHGVQRIILLSSSCLATAVGLYESMGFRRAPIPDHNPYITADVYMELDLPCTDRL